MFVLSPSLTHRLEKGKIYHKDGSGGIMKNISYRGLYIVCFTSHFVIN